MRGPQVLRKRIHSLQSATRVEGKATHVDPVRHSGEPGREVIAVAGHQLLGEAENIALQLEQVLDGVVVLKAVQAPDPNLFGFLPRGRLGQHGFQSGEQAGADFIIQAWLLLRGHVIGFDNIDEFLDQFWLGQELFRRRDFPEIDLALCFLVSMTFRAVLGQEGPQESFKIVGRAGTRKGGDDEPDQQERLDGAQRWRDQGNHG